MNADPMEKIRELAKEIAETMELGRRTDIFLVVRSRSHARINGIASIVSDELGCSESEARVAMKEYVANLKKYDPVLLREIQ